MTEHSPSSASMPDARNPKDRTSAMYLRLYWTLVASFCVLGVCIATAQPLFSVPDEFTHWYAGHTRVEKFLGTEGCVATFDPERHRRRHTTLPPFEKLRKTPLKCMDGEELYGDLLTYPGLLLSKIVLPRQQSSSIRQMQAIMLTRLLQGMIFVGGLLRLGVLARRARRPGLLLAAAFALSPLLAQQAFGVSSDGAQLGFALCLFSIVVFWELLGPIDLVLFLFLGWGATAKPFVLTCIVPSIIAGFWYAQLRAGEDPGVREIVRRFFAALRIERRPSVQTLVLWSGLLLSALTVLFVLLQQLGGDSTAPAEPTHFDMRAQLAGIREHPSKLVDITVNQVPEPWLLSNYAGPLGWLDTEVSRASVHSFFQIIGLGCALEVIFLTLRWRRQHAPRWRELGRRIRRALPPFIIGLIGPMTNVVFVAFVLYVSWTPVGAARPAGMQARYYLASVITLIAVISGALEVLLKATPSAGPEAPAEIPARPASPLARYRPQLLRAARVLGPAMILALTLPYVARVFLDIEQRYR